MNNCCMCGASIPEGQRICSMCYGDVDHGRDGYYEEYMRSHEPEQERMREGER